MSAADSVIDARGRAVLPGLVNTHTHIASNILARGLLDDVSGMDWLDRLWSLKAHFRPDDLFVASKVGIAEMLLSGTTCYNELFDGYDPVPGIAAMSELGVRAVAGWCLADDGVYADTAGDSWRDVRSMRELKSRFHETADGRVTLAIAPHAPYSVSKKLAAAARAAADEHGLRLHTHLAEVRQETELIQERFGQSPVEYFLETGLLGPDLIAAHCSQFNDADFEAFAATGASIAHCPTCNSRSLTGYLPVRQAWEHGIVVGLGTDGPASNNSLDMFAETKFATTLHRFVSQDINAVSARQALEMATLEAARSLGMADQIGSLEPGKRADVIVVNLERAELAPMHNIYGTLVYAGTGRRVETVMVDGRVLVQDGEVVVSNVSVDVDELNRRASAIARAGLPEELLCAGR